jgi:hypothetical protein
MTEMIKEISSQGNLLTRGKRIMVVKEDTITNRVVKENTATEKTVKEIMTTEKVVQVTLIRAPKTEARVEDRIEVRRTGVAIKEATIKTGHVEVEATKVTVITLEKVI